jgi:hypothetical protein
VARRYWLSCAGLAVQTVMAVLASFQPRIAAQERGDAGAVAVLRTEHAHLEGITADKPADGFCYDRTKDCEQWKL